MNRRDFILGVTAIAVLPAAPATPELPLTIEDAMEGVLARVMARLDAREMASSRPWATSGFPPATSM